MKSNLVRYIVSRRLLSSFVALAALFFPVAENVSWMSHPGWMMGPLFVVITTLLVNNNRDLQPGRELAILISLTIALWVGANIVHSEQVIGSAAPGFWVFVFSLGLSVWSCTSWLSSLKVTSRVADRLNRLLIPGLFGVWLLILWEFLVVGFGIPHVLLPAPSVIQEAFASSTDVLMADFRQTVIRAVIPGFIIGNAVGFVVALLADKIPFLRRGLLPVGNLVSAIPIVGIAPIMVMWFGFDWQSKAAVVVIMTFFPMLVNVIAGLSESGNMELDLMRSYGATYWQGFFKLRLPNAMPFIFNALKINSTLALIGAIVAEFFGTPIVGMGFRISTEVGRMNIEMVWASIAVAAMAGSIFYGLLAVLERRVTFWHSSVRKAHS